MNISKEAKIGISTLVVIIMVYWGINFLKGMNVLEDKEVYYISMQDASGIVVSTAVTTKGVTIGSVAEVELLTIESDVTVEIVVNAEYQIPKDSHLSLMGGGLMDAQKLVLIPGKSTEFLSGGDTINFESSPSMMQTINTLSAKLSSVLSQVDTLMTKVNKVVNDDTIGNINETFENLNKATANANNLISSQTVRIDRIMTNLDKLTKTFSESTPELKATLSNLETMTGSMSGSVPKILSDIQNILSKVNSQDGTVGKLLNNDDLYNNLDTTLINLSVLLEDLKNNPKNYVQFSLFEKESAEEKRLRKAEKKRLKKY